MEEQITFEFEGDPAEADDAANDLVAWIDEDDDLRGTAEPRVKPPAPGEMGAMADAAHVALSAAGPMAKVVGTWLMNRLRNKGPVKVNLSREGHGSLLIEAGSVAEVEALIPSLREFFAA